MIRPLLVGILFQLHLTLDIAPARILSFIAIISIITYTFQSNIILVTEQLNKYYN